MNRKEAKRVFVVEQLIEGKLSIEQAAQLLELSERQVKRIKKGVKEQGIEFLIHKNRGKVPNHALPEETRELIVEKAINEYRDATCTHMAELLATHNDVSVSDRTVRRILAQAVVPNKHAHKAARGRRSRDRMPQEGMLVQLDASHHAWLEERAPKMSLHGAVDDATSKILGLHFEAEECLNGYFHVLMQVSVHHGVPLRYYTDRHTIFFSPMTDKLSIEDELTGKRVALTQFGRALSEMCAHHIPAHSPQAKGRIERLWGTLQNRLIMEMRVSGITSLSEANSFLPSFIDRFNERFAVHPIDHEVAYQPAPSLATLKTIICQKHDRKADNGSVISYGGQRYRLADEMSEAISVRPKSRITVLVHPDGSLSALHGDKHYDLQVFNPAPIMPETVPTKKADAPAPPAANHPWRKPPRRVRKPIIETYLEDIVWKEICMQR